MKSVVQPGNTPGRVSGRFWPQSLLWRTFVLVALLMLLSVAAWFAIFSTYEREPRARQLAQTLASVANLTRAALLAARPEARLGLLRELSDREGIHIYPADAEERVAPLPTDAFLLRVQEHVQQEMGPRTRLTLKREDEEALFVSFRIDETDDEEFWLALPSARIQRVFPASWIGWGIAAMLLSLIGAWLIVFRITRPLKALERAAHKVGAGETAQPLAEVGPTEVATVARAFNQMNADLARLDQDRALILAGISHDLRTPLTRLRMGIEMSVEESMREGMSADVEEMDKTIAQFLDFARTEGGEPSAPLDVAALIAELAAQYARRSLPVTLAPEAGGAALPSPTFQARPQALRRAITNLIDNALRYAPGAAPEIGLIKHPRELHIEIRDRGPGIPLEDVERMKRPFTRLDAARSNVVGAGLGLAIVDRIARSHGGQLELLVRDGGGLVARLILPTP
jgi:two-component system osmolarity sensor histidine kinase EnvZ